MYQLTVKLDHDMPFSNISKRFPQVNLSRWCNLEVDILEAESPHKEKIESFQQGLQSELEQMSASLIHVHRYSESALEAVIRCKCSMSNSSIAIVEASNCIPVMPITYREGFEYVRLLAFDKENRKAVLDNLGSVAKLAVVSSGQVESHVARSAMTISVDDFLGSLTSKQLLALIEAIEDGYYSTPKSATVEELAERLGMPRSTFEEHLRKAEIKVMRAMRPYVRMAYQSSRGMR
ncbi:MAG: helix-turn-helix domain-containing protein [Nitrososphaerota archaeon]|jgi:predicted DNA binding protein|nr:helix-turn-helix domain-containing protein [Nitrososphaerota archaeon]